MNSDDKLALSLSPLEAPPLLATVATIKQLEERLRQAMLTNDIPELDKLLSERLMFVGPDGILADKAADMLARRSVTTLS